MTRHTCKVLVLATVLSVVWFYSAFASAKIVRWDLQNVRFTDGATVSGFFLWDANAGPGMQAASWDITVAGGPDPYRFTPDTSVLFWSFSQAFSVQGPEIAPRVALELDILFGCSAVPCNALSNLSDAGGTVDILAQEWYSYIGTVRYASGQVVAIPEASCELFLAVGLITLVAWRGKVPSSAFNRAS